MERNTTQQEILLITGATFFQNQLCEKTEQDSRKNMSQPEKLEEACWNGLLNELLPGIIVRSATGKALLLSHIRHCKAFLEIDLCDVPVEQEYYYSIDPYVFLQAGFEN